MEVLEESHICMCQEKCLEAVAQKFKYFSLSGTIKKKPASSNVVAEIVSLQKEKPESPAKQ